MPRPTPFHARTAALCTSLRWKEWAGYYAVCSFDTSFEREYMAYRHSAGLLDVSPLQKLDVRGRDAARFVSYVSTRDAEKLAVGRVVYGPWCDGDGWVVDDGTITKKAPDHFRLTTADPSYAWFSRLARDFAVALEDETDETAALALQGPTARAVLCEACGEDLAGLRFFRWRRASIGGVAVEITRTGYTGDLGYELWVPAAEALRVWDVLLEVGLAHGLEPAGLDALDVARVEAGFLLQGIDYTSARRALTRAQKRTPWELGLGWGVELEREGFLGEAALRASAGRPRWQFVGLVYDWPALEAAWERRELSVSVGSGAWRGSLAVWSDLEQVGHATSGAWSPICKQKLALASVRPSWADLGRELAIDVTIDHQSQRTPVRVAARPFFDPERKRS